MDLNCIRILFIGCYLMILTFPVLISSSNRIPGTTYKSGKKESTIDIY